VPVELTSESGFRTGFVIAGAAAVLAALVALTVPGRQRAAAVAAPGPRAEKAPEVTAEAG
jgi:hypothetical protein